MYDVKSASKNSGVKTGPARLLLNCKSLASEQSRDINFAALVPLFQIQTLTQTPTLTNTPNHTLTQARS